jgi:hypothetical protein
MIENSWSHFDENQRKMLFAKRPNFFHEAEFLGKFGRIILIRIIKHEARERVIIFNSITNRKAELIIRLVKKKAKFLAASGLYCFVFIVFARVLCITPPVAYGARNYRPCFRENQPKRSFSIK